MAGLTLTIPHAFEIRVASVGEWKGEQAVRLQVRQMIDGDGTWQQAEPLRVLERPHGGKDVLSLNIEHHSIP